jgi:hypothetical protein
VPRANITCTSGHGSAAAVGMPATEPNIAEVAATTTPKTRVTNLIKTSPSL